MAGKVRKKMQFRLLPLTIFAAVLLLGVRVGDLWGVIAHGDRLPEISPLQAQTPPAPAKPAAPASGSAPAVPAPAVPAPAAAAAEESGSDAPPPPAVAMEMVRQINERRAQLDERTKALDQREAILVVAEKRLEQKLVEMEALRGQIETMLRQLDSKQQEQMMSLVKIYETMKPKEAARILEGMEGPVLLDVVERMKEAKVAPILAAMDPGKAKELTAALAERRQLPESARQ